MTSDTDIGCMGFSRFLSGIQTTRFHNGIKVIIPVKSNSSNYDLFVSYKLVRLPLLTNSYVKGTGGGQREKLPTTFQKWGSLRAGLYL